MGHFKGIVSQLSDCDARQCTRIVRPISDNMYISIQFQTPTTSRSGTLLAPLRPTGQFQKKQPSQGISKVFKHVIVVVYQAGGRFRAKGCRRHDNGLAKRIFGMDFLLSLNELLGI